MSIYLYRCVYMQPCCDKECGTGRRAARYLWYDDIQRFGLSWLQHQCSTHV